MAKEYNTFSAVSFSRTALNLALIYVTPYRTERRIV